MFQIQPQHSPLAIRVFKFQGILGKVIAIIFCLPLALIDFIYLVLFLLEQILPLNEEDEENKIETHQR